MSEGIFHMSSAAILPPNFLKHVDEMWLSYLQHFRGTRSQVHF